MGCCLSKDEKTIRKRYMQSEKRLGLRCDEAEYLYQLLGDRISVPISHVVEMWQNIITEECLNIYKNYLLLTTPKTHGPDAVDAVTFSLFLANFVKGTMEDKVDMYLTFMEKNENDEILVEKLKTYLIQLIKSVLKMMVVKQMVQYEQWLEKSNPFTDEDITRWVSGTLINEKGFIETGVLNRRDMNSWLTSNTDIITMQCFLFYSLYDMDKLDSYKSIEQRSAYCPLPFLEANVEKEDWRAIINIPAVIYINCHLPPKNRYQWRLAYSADIHGQGFTTLHTMISNVGPSVLIIKDCSGHIFGGFASTSWRIGPKFFGNHNCFMFSLLPRMQIFPTLPHNDHFLYLNANQKTLPNGLGMGGQLGYWGLWIDSSFEFGTCSRSCSTYSDFTMLSGTSTFAIADLEVWSVERVKNSSEEEGSTTTLSESISKSDEPQSILHKDLAARALMDMIGKENSGGHEFLK